MKNIILIGMPGCGKTTIGKIIAKRLKMSFLDTDAVFEKEKGMSISEFFKNYEEPIFRAEETELLSRLCKNESSVISTGGGVVEIEKNKELIRKNGIVVFINRSPENIMSDIKASHRPLIADDKTRIFTLYDKRLPRYKDFCHIEIKNDGSLESITEKIINEVNHYNV